MTRDTTDYDLSPIVEELCTHSHALTRTGAFNREAQLLPSRKVLLEVVEGLRGVLFPRYFGESKVSEETLRFHLGATLDHVRPILEEQVEHCLEFVRHDAPDERAECRARAHDVVRELFQRLPAVRAVLATDVQAAFDGDPAATSPDEAIFCYPGITAVTCQRLAHELYKLEVPLLPRMITEYAHTLTGIDIHPGAQIGERFFIDHGTGVVIGETCIIGNNVCLYQGVTLGAKSFPKDENSNPIKGIDRHPIVEDDVTIYGGATILGRVTIGKGSVIGGNVWLTRSIRPRTKVVLPQARGEAFVEGAGI
ncbi:MAG: serine acetyltransferase [Deltaproteobacteria bacterium]|nr:serine acetyltransferase [Deltaproteobacteria bacterium]